LQSPWVPSAVKDRQYPDLVFVDHVINSIKLEPMYRRPAHIGKPDSMEKRRFAQRLNGAVNLRQKFIA
jgi:hypothetical protein